MATLALARHVPTSFPKAISMQNNDSTAPHSSINYEKAVEEHATYLDTLRQYLPVVCLPPLNDFPDSMFVEDTMVAIGKKAVITNPGHQSRRSECATIQTFVQDYLGMTTTSMQEHNRQHQSSTQTPAYCDGGDVLSLGNKLFVGINGTRTNYEAVPLLEHGLEVEVIPIPFTSSVDALHLKSILTHVDEHTVLVPDTELGQRVVHTLMQEANVVYEIVTLPSHATLSCNVVVVPNNSSNNNKNGLLMAQLVHDDDHKTRQILHEVAHERALDLKFITAKEAAKADGALTCCSVLLDL